MEEFVKSDTDGLYYRTEDLVWLVEPTLRRMLMKKIQKFSIQCTLVTNGEKMVTEAAVKKLVNRCLKKNEMGEITFCDAVEWSKEMIEQGEKDKQRLKDMK